MNSQIENGVASMNKEELAALLHGREYGAEITKSESAAAKKAGLLVIFGQSDDLCELRGAIDDEIGVYQDTLILISREGTILAEIDDDDIDVLEKYGALGFVQKLHSEAAHITARWCASDWSWTYETAVPHAAFDVMENGEKYCRGIVIDLGSLA